MKWVVDTCVWSLLFRRKDRSQLNAEQIAALTELESEIRKGRVVILGPIRQELLSGLRDAAEFERMRKAIEPFPDSRLATADYVEAAHCENLCRSRGVACGPIDMLICAVALRRQWSVLTLDQGLIRCLQALGGKSQ